MMAAGLAKSLDSALAGVEEDERGEIFNDFVSRIQAVVMGFRSSTAKHILWKELNQIEVRIALETNDSGLRPGSSGDFDSCKEGWSQ